MGKRVEIIQLLKDYNNYLPGGSGEAFVPVNAGGGDYNGWPLSPELVKRMDKKSLAGETYMHLDMALSKMKYEKPLLWEVLYRAYLQDDVGHSQVDYWRQVGGSSNTWYSQLISKLIDRHDEAIEWLDNELKDTDLWVTFPNKAPGPKPGTPMQERHDELIVVYLRYRSEGMNITESLRNAALKCDYHERRAWEILKGRLDEGSR